MLLIIKAISVLILTISAAYGNVCRSKISLAERSEGLPPNLLQAIATVETGRAAAPWPWTINAKGLKNHFYNTKDAAHAAAVKLMQSGKTNVDLGCIQINYHYHGKNFKNVREILDPHKNIFYGAKLLKEMYRKLGSWEKVVARYHSADPARGKAYQKKVYETWNKINAAEKLNLRIIHQLASCCSTCNKK